MIEIICGKKGSGKTKRLISQTNEAVESSRGNIIFIDDDKDYLYDIRHQVRFIDASEYDIDSPKMFYGFLCGLVAQDFDLDTIFIDAFLRIVKYPMSQLEECFQHMERIVEKHNIRLVLSVSCAEEEIPEYAAKYIQK
nr:hypothetical protein [Maliibacterium massiliense]